MPYNLTNLIRYDDTIRLHFDTAGKTAWLTMKNYGCVFGMEPADDVWVVTVGVAAIESGDLPEDPAVQRALVALGIQQGEFKPYLQSISIGEMLDAIDVIKLQVAILKITSAHDEKVLPRRAANAVISDALGTLGDRKFVMLFSRDDKNFFATTKQNLDQLLNSSPGVPAIAKQIKDYGEKNRNPQDEIPENEVGFTAYFPKADLILQEERTTLIDDGSGKTTNLDPRYIEPIPSGLPEPIDQIDPAIAHQIDLDFRAGKKPLYRPPEWEFQWIVDELDRGFREKHPSDADRVRKLHGQIKRISCFALRGDSRNPVEHRETNGFLPGLTRTDPGVDGYSDIKFAINRTLTARPGWVDDPAVKQTIHPLYLEVIRRFNLLHLGVFTATPEFKGFISTTKSAAIAKYFANQYAKEIECQHYCYAVRCRGGFHLDSHVPEDTTETPQAYLQTLHTFNSYAEQEVAVAGAIWWEHIFGMRVLQCNQNGQFFSGPIFMKSDLIWEDNFAFSTFFELLSGKSQGEAKGAIHKSYENAPFQYAEAWLTEIGANSVSQASTITVPLVRVNPTQLTFGRQPAGTRSAAQTVTLTNLGTEPVFIIYAKIENDKGGDFKTYISKDLTGPAVEVQKGEPFELPVHFIPRNAGDPTGTKCTGTLVILTKTSINDHGPGTRYQISLSGTAVPKPASLEVSPQLLAFGDVAMGTISATRIVALINRSEKVIKIPNIKIYSPYFSSDFAGAELNPHESSAINVKFRAPDIPGTWEGKLEVWCEGTIDPKAVTLTGTAAKPSCRMDLTPVRLDFDAWNVGTRSDFKYVTLENKGNAVVTISKVELDPLGDFEVEAIGDEDPELRAGESRHVRVHFEPKTAGKKNTKLRISYKIGHQSQVVTLVGIGVSKIFSSDRVNFNNVKLESSKENDVMLRNPGDFQLSIVELEIKTKKKAEFHTAVSGGFVLSAKDKFSIKITFSPKAEGERKGTLTVRYIVEGSNKVVTQSVELIGSGEKV